MPYIPQLSKEQRVEALTATHELWSGGRTLAERVDKTAALMAEFPGKLTFAGVVNDKGSLVASLKRYRLSLIVSGEPVPAVGLGAIFTDPALRRKGAAAHLISEVLREAFGSGARAALLFSDIDPGYYQARGFHLLPASTAWAEVGSMAVDATLSLAPAAAGDLPFMMTLRSEAHHPLMIRPHADAEHWKFFRKMNFTGQDHLLLRGGEPVGYLSAVVETDALWVEEVFCRKGVPAEAAWGAARRLAESQGLKRVGTWVDPDYPNPGFTLEKRKKAVPMLAASPGTDLGLPLTRAWFGSLDHF